MMRVFAYLASAVLLSASMVQAAPKLADSTALDAGIAGLRQDASDLSAPDFAYDAVAKIAGLYGLTPAPRPQPSTAATLAFGRRRKGGGG